MAGAGARSAVRHARRVVDGVDLGQVDATTLRRMCWLREIDEDTLQQELRRRARQGEPVAV